jgi:hypothetical protein
MILAKHVSQRGLDEGRQLFVPLGLTAIDGSSHGFCRVPASIETSSP